MSAVLQKMTAAALLPSAIFAEMAARTLSLAAENTRSLLSSDKEGEFISLPAPSETQSATTNTATQVGVLAVPAPGSLPD